MNIPTAHLDPDHYMHPANIPDLDNDEPEDDIIPSCLLAENELADKALILRGDSGILK